MSATFPTKNTRHIDIRYLALCNWAERDLIYLEPIDTSINIADQLTKILSWAIFHKHADYLLGHIPPKYLPIYQQVISTYSNKFQDDIDQCIPETFRTPMTAAVAWIFMPIQEDMKSKPWLIILWHE
jgi:hypothetical protein